MEWVHRELTRKKSVTLQLLWMEYKEQHPDGYQYTQFCEHYRRWSKRLDVVMRQPHVAGEKMFVDFAGETVPVIDPKTGTASQAEVFVAVLGASNYTYAEVCPSQELEHWLGAHVRALESFGGVPKVFVPDNLKSAIQRPCRYEPDMNPAYHELATHYGAVVIPARTYKARDKAKVEVGVQVVERSVLAALRKRRFFSLTEAQAAIREAVCALNARPFKRLSGPGNRGSKPWRNRRSTPCLPPGTSTGPGRRRGCRTTTTWRSSAITTACLRSCSDRWLTAGSRPGRWRCSSRAGASLATPFARGQARSSPIRLHQPESHRRYAEWSTEKAALWAIGIGPSMVSFIESVVASKGHPEQARRACLGIVRLGRSYDRERLESAAARALAIRSVSYRSLETILRYDLDKVAVQRLELAGVGNHSNIRGPEYYRSAEVRPC